MVQYRNIQSRLVLPYIHIAYWTGILLKIVWNKDSVEEIP